MNKVFRPALMLMLIAEAFKALPIYAKTHIVFGGLLSVTTIIFAFIRIIPFFMAITLVFLVFLSLGWVYIANIGDW